MNRPDIPAPLSFDSRGINDKSSKYCDRLFTLTFDRVNDPRCQALGKALAALPDLMAALEEIASPLNRPSWERDKARAALLKAGYAF